MTYKLIYGLRLTLWAAPTRPHPPPIPFIMSSIPHPSRRLKLKMLREAGNYQLYIFGNKCKSNLFL